MNFFQLHSSSITGGHDYKLFKSHAQRLVRSNNFSIKVINHWESLPPNIVNAPSVNLFKKTWTIISIISLYIINK